MKTVTRYVAFDGTEFDMAEACEQYEAKNFQSKLVDLSPDDVEAAFAGKHPELADAFERAGALCAKARRARGHLKRKPNGSRSAEAESIAA